MMTKIRAARLVRKIRESRARLLDEHPFFGILLMYFRFVAVKDIRTASTNGSCIYLFPDYLDKLCWYETDFLLCHLLIHVLREDIWRPSEHAGNSYHHAFDILVNHELDAYGYDRDRYPHLGRVYKEIPSGLANCPEGCNAYDVYAHLPYRLFDFNEAIQSDFMIDSDAYWDKKEDVGTCGEMLLDIEVEDPILTETKEVSASTAWQARVGAAARAASMGASKDTKKDERFLGKGKEAAVDWKEALSRFIQEEICDYSFAPPDRRYDGGDFFLPDFNEKEFSPKDILFMVDTSGSMNEDAIARAYAEIAGAIQQFDGKLCGRLGFFDVEVTPPIPFERVEDIKKIIPYGGGGTDFYAVFEYVRDRYSGAPPSCLILFTDGYAKYPPAALAADIPTLWLINNGDSTPPFGKTLRIIE